MGRGGDLQQLLVCPAGYGRPALVCALPRCPTCRPFSAPANPETSDVRTARIPTAAAMGWPSRPGGGSAAGVNRAQVRMARPGAPLRPLRPRPSRRPLWLDTHTRRLFFFSSRPPRRHRRRFLAVPGTFFCYSRMAKQAALRGMCVGAARGLPTRSGSVAKGPRGCFAPAKSTAPERSTQRAPCGADADLAVEARKISARRRAARVCTERRAGARPGGRPRLSSSGVEGTA